MRAIWLCLFGAMFMTKFKRNLHLLSIDNEGFRGLSSLLILRELLLRIQKEEMLPDIPLPCELFDLAGGSGTGGIIVIMLFRLQMSIDTAIDAYIKLSEHVFSEKKRSFQEGTFKATRLEEAMLSIVQECEVGDPRQVRLLNKEGPKCFVAAMRNWSRGVCLPTFFRSWTCDSYPEATVVEAVRATTAVPTFFKTARVGGELYLDPKLQCCNPALFVIENARELFGDRPISCLLSLGTSCTDIFPLKSPCLDPSQQWLPIKFRRALIDVIMRCDETSVEVYHELSRHFSSILYLRLNDDQCPWVHMLPAEWRRLSYLQARAKAYVMKVDSSWQKERLDKLVILICLTLKVTSDPR